MNKRISGQQLCNDLETPHEGFIIVEENRRQFHVCADSRKPAYPERYLKAETFQDGLAWVQKEDGTWKVIDTKGNEVSCPHALPFGKR